MTKNYRNYKKYSSNNPTTKEPIDEVSTADISETVTKPTTGKVTNCSKLNVRESANKDSDILCVIEVDSKLQINIEESTNDFYKVCTPAGVEGYCMKDYISLK